MTKDQFTSHEIALIEAEAKEYGFTTEDFLDCQAGLWRLAVLNNSGYFDGKLDGDGHNAFTEKIEPTAIEPEHKFDQRHDPKVAAAYLIFPDGSLYFDNNARDEVWAFADDFAHEVFDSAGTSRGVSLENLSEIDIELLRHLEGPNNAFGEIVDWAEGLPALTECLENFVASEDFADGVVSATRASYGGSGYSVELYRDGHWRVLWNDQIGNGYDSPGIILGLPTFESAYDASEDDEGDYDLAKANEAGAIKEALGFELDTTVQQMRDALRERFER